MFGVYLSLYIGTLLGRLFRQRFPLGRRFFNEIACISRIVLGGSARCRGAEHRNYDDDV